MLVACVLLGSILSFSGVKGQTELLKDPGFEKADFPDWKSWGFTQTTTTTDVHGGRRAMSCTGRTASWQGPGQPAPIHAGGRYSFRAYVKFLNDKPGKLFQTIKVTISYDWADGSGKAYYDVAQHSFSRSADGWFSITGTFSAPLKSWSDARLYFQGPDPGVDFLVDDTSLVEVPENTHWKTEANSRIENLRKSNLHFVVHAASHFDPHHLDIEIQHQKHLFGFGSVVHDDWIVNPDYKEYQNLFYHMFNWGTVGSFKWRYAKGTRDHPDYSFAVNAMNELIRNGVSVRGHNMFWGIPHNLPDWVLQLSSSQLKSTIEERVQLMTRLTRGKLAHWDVNNELLHGQYFEEKTGDPGYSMKIYDMVHKADPHPQLFLNDYDVVATGANTQGYVDQAKAFLKANAALHGLGVQSHFRDHVAPDATLLKMSLDSLATTGLPLWITEMDLVSENENTRADWYETALRMYFSHPAVEGVIFWGFWDHQAKLHSALVSGNNYYVNEAGRRYLNLIKNEWSTNMTHNMAAGSTFNMRGFQGDYSVVVRYQGKPIAHQTVHLGKSDQTVQLHVQGNGHEIQLPTTVNPFAHAHHTGTVTHTNDHAIGSASSSSHSSTLRCVTRRSGYSEVGDDKTTSVGCQHGEVLTGCSGFSQNHDWHRDGEKMERHAGQFQCIATNGFRATAPVQAVARCCQLRGLQCSYRTAGPSDKSIDDKIESRCTGRQYAVGCTAYTWNTDMDGSYSTNHSCIAQNDGTEIGVFTYAACCQAPHMTCSVKFSAPSDMKKGDTATVGCDGSDVMLGCSGYSEDGRLAGAYITENGNKDTCTAVNGADKFGNESGVKAVATCCRLN